MEQIIPVAECQSFAHSFSTHWVITVLTWAPPTAFILRPCSPSCLLAVTASGVGVPSGPGCSGRAPTLSEATAGLTALRHVSLTSLVKVIYPRETGSLLWEPWPEHAGCERHFPIRTAQVHVSHGTLMSPPGKQPLLSENIGAEQPWGGHVCNGSCVPMAVLVGSKSHPICPRCSRFLPIPASLAERPGPNNCHVPTSHRSLKP